MKCQALIVVALLSVMHLGFAEPIVVPNNQNSSQIQSNLAKANQSIEQIKLQKEQLVTQLQAIEKQQGDIAQSLHSLSLQIDTKQQRLKHLSKEMKKQYAALKLQNNELAKQVRASFVMGKKEQLKLLLNQQDPALASRMLVYYEYFNKSRIRKLTEIRTKIALLDHLEQEKRRETTSLDQALRSHQSVQVGLSDIQKQREALLVHLGNEFKKKSQQLALLEANADEVQALIDRLQQSPTVAGQQEENDTVRTPPDVAEAIDGDGNQVSPNDVQTENPVATVVDKPFAELKRQLPWPVKGTIIKKFGSRRSADTRWDGLLIAAQEGTDIQAASSGRVVFADWLRGYGLLIIIDHGHGYMTLYAFNQSVYKKVGDRVKAGTVIGAVGKSDGREESGLYFGIRSKGKPVDPMIWCKKG